jgi:hypothetical protein
MGEELRILKERGSRIVLTLTGKRLTLGAEMSLRATLGVNVLANLPLPRGPTKPDEDEAPRKTKGPSRTYTERRSLTELIRLSVKRLQDGEAGPITGSAVVPGTKKEQTKVPGGRKRKTVTTTEAVPEQDWLYKWQVEEITVTTRRSGPRSNR